MKTEARRAAIIEKSMELFLKKGYSQVSVNDICKALQMTKPTFYHYVESKDLILGHYFYLRQKEAESRLQELIDQNRQREALKLLLFFVHETARKIGPELMGESIIYFIKNNISDYRYGSSIEKRAVNLLRNMQENGLLILDADPVKLYRTICQLDAGILLRWCAESGDFDLDECLINAIETGVSLQLAEIVKTAD